MGTYSCVHIRGTRGGAAWVVTGGFLLTGTGAFVVTGVEEMIDDVVWPPLPADEVDSALLVVAFAAALCSDVTVGPLDEIIGIIDSELFDTAADSNVGSVVGELFSVVADVAGGRRDGVVRMVLLAVVEVAKPDRPDPIPIADERRSPKNAKASSPETSGSDGP